MTEYICPKHKECDSKVYWCSHKSNHKFINGACEGASCDRFIIGQVHHTGCCVPVIRNKAEFKFKIEEE